MSVQTGALNLRECLLPVSYTHLDVYKRQALACALNLLSSHDRPRIISVLGGGPDESQLPESERSKWRLDENSMGLALSLIHI